MGGLAIKLVEPPDRPLARRWQDRTGLHLRRGLAGPGSIRAMQFEVLEAVASRLPLEDVALLLCGHVERLAPKAICSVLKVENRRIYPLAAPSLPPEFSGGIDGLEIGPEVGSCGTAAHFGEPVEVLDIETDPRWAPFNALPLAAGLRACWSTPIKHDGQVVGTFAFYYRTRRGPTPMERRLVDASVHLCAVALAHEMVWSRLRRTNERFDVALSNLSQGVCFFDGDRRLIVANRRFSEIYRLAPDQIVAGISLQEIVAMRIRAGCGPRMDSALYLQWRDGVQVSDVPIDTEVELEDRRIIAIHHRPMPDSGWVATHEDVTDRRRVEAQIVHMARHDALTGLPNRSLLQERLDQALAGVSRGQACAVLCVDLDRFKSVNDTLGHSAGDVLLRLTSERLWACVREVDTVTRLGGDEFAILLAGLEQPAHAAEVGRRIVQTLCEPFELDGHSVTVSASVGIAIAPQDGMTPGKLLKSADTAMYRAKLEDRGSYCFFEPEMDARLQTRLQLERDLRDAVREQRFELAFQPLINVATGRICAFEALLRWRHPERGQVYPADFIPVAEETGLIVPLGAWVIHQACAEAAHWPSPIKVAVNLSAVQFRNRALVATVADALGSTGLHPSRLELEVTETVLLRHNAETLSILHELRAMGVGISLDDFGTGYSSLRYLRSFPFDKIKIDQSFVRDLSDTKDSVAIIRAIVSLGGSLGMITTAEGVETRDQLDQVRREGCTEVQGYLFSRPVGNDAARAMAAEGCTVMTKVA